MYDANTLSSQTPARRRPCSFREDWLTTVSNSTSSSVITARDRDTHQAQYYSTSMATRCTNVCLKPKGTRATTRAAPPLPSWRLRCSRRPGPRTAMEVGSSLRGEWQSSPIFFSPQFLLLFFFHLFFDCGGLEF
ncbi:hypothetical protein B0H19DRAFT_436023 [Mycena capillaripes]|nr:hypothetical protein B0H19DRAFT_436023 [Mycena capillaripes]